MGCTLVVRSGPCRVRFVGWNFSGLRWNKANSKSPEVRVPRTGYSLFSDARGASVLNESEALCAQARLKYAGVDIELL